MDDATTIPPTSLAQARENLIDIEAELHAQHRATQEALQRRDLREVPRG